MKALIRKFKSILAKRDPPLDPGFNPPASKKQISSAERSLGVKLPKDLQDFLLAANGQTEDCHSEGDVVVPRLRFAKGQGKLTAEGWFADVDSIVERTLFDRQYRDAKPIPKTKRWGSVKSHAGLINITVSDSPWLLAVDLKPDQGGVVGQVVSVNEFPEQTVWIAPSLTDFIRRLIEGFSEDRYQVDEDGYLSEG